jgi:hypothetical protein
MSKTPELDKMLVVRDDSQKIGEFLGWLSEQSIVLAEFDTVPCRDCGCEREALVHTRSNREQLLADYFKIDLNKCEQERERQQILGGLRQQNEKANKNTD